MNPFYFHLKQNISSTVGSKRIFHGRGKAFLEFDYFNIDYFSPYIIFVFYKEPKSEFLEELKTFFVGLKSDYSIEGILYQKRFLPKAPTEIIFGSVPDEYNCLLDDLTFNLKFNSSQNLGLFLDFELGRNYLKNHVQDKKVLNLFSYTCALSVFALNFGASKVINMDMSKMAMRRGELNHRLNKLDLNKVKFLDHDIFKSFGKLTKDGPYDLVIIDPPSDHGEHFKIERDYPKLIKRVEDWLTPSGEAMICINSPHLSFAFLEEMVKANSVNLELKESFGFPEYFLEQNRDSGLKITIWKRGRNE